MTMVVRRLARSSPSNAACTTRSEAVSSADVASSRIRRVGSRTTARAIAMRCFWPPESRSPFSPTAVPNPSGKPATNSWAFASRALASMSSAFTGPSLPRAMFSPMVPLKSTGSCETRPICDRSQRRLSAGSATPSSRTSPPDGS
mmetsp:Transcript_83453/g.236779  ORF Transcript_83453/g.236779 Transcript_83453/m.236779 type:complete len:145 (+) Transcript_83453:413-847(+)